MTYALLLTAAWPYEPREVARVVADVTARTAIDAGQSLNHGRGLLAERLTLDQAQVLGQRLGELGLITFCVPDTELQPPVRPLRVTKARVAEDGFEIEDQLGRRTLEPWPGLRLLTAVSVQVVEESPEGVRRTMPTLLGPDEKPLLRVGEDDEEHVERQHLVDLVFGEALPRHYRLEAGSFNYQYLAVDGRLSLRRDENLVALVRDLVAHAGETWVTPAARALSEGRLEAGSVITEGRLYDAELRWRLQRLRALGIPEQDPPVADQAV